MTTATIDRQTEVQRCTERVRQLIAKGVGGQRLDHAQDRLEAAEARVSKKESRAQRASSIKNQLARERAVAQGAEQQRRVKAAEADFRRTSTPIATLTYGPITVTLRAVGRDAVVEPGTMAEAAKNAMRLMQQHFTVALGNARGKVVGAAPEPTMAFARFADRLRYELGKAITLGVCTVTIK